MDISLTPNMENILRNKVSEGMFASMDEAIIFAINFTFLDSNISKERIDMLNAEIEKGWQDIENGRYRDGDKVMKELMKKYA